MLQGTARHPYQQPHLHLELVGGDHEPLEDEHAGAVGDEAVTLHLAQAKACRQASRQAWSRANEARQGGGGTHQHGQSAGTAAPRGGSQRHVKTALDKLLTELPSEVSSWR